MSSTENRQHSPSEGLQIPGLVQNQEPVEQLSFSANPATPTSGLAGPESASGLENLDTQRQPISSAGVPNPGTPFPAFEPGSTRALLLQSQPAVTRALTNALSQHGISAQPPAGVGPQRPQVVIQGDKSKTKGLPRPPQGRRHVIGIAAILLLLLITAGTLLAASPLNHQGDLGFNPLNWGSNLARGNPNNDLSLVAQATATAVFHQRNDGFDPNAGGSGPVVTGGPHTWPLGVCTYWANARYHALTGNWVTWTGNAYQWAQGARLAGWNVSSTPHAYSIIVLMPGVQGASGYGHVAVVESVSGNVAHTSNMNWYSNGGGWDRVSNYDFTAGSGVYFIWK